MTKEDSLASRQVLDALDKYDSERIFASDKKNELEALIYSKSNWLESEENKKVITKFLTNFNQYTTDDELSRATKSLNGIKNWFEEDGFNANVTAIEKKHKELVASFRNIDKRIKKHQEKDYEVENFDSNLNKTYTKANKVLTASPWTEDYYNTKFSVEYLEVQTWFNEKVREQDRSPFHEVIIIR